jgi:hypothetical protein
MPSSPKFDIETIPYCNLRQAVQWIRDGTTPVQSVYEAALGTPAELHGDYVRAKSDLFLAISAGVIVLFGRPSIDAPKYDSKNSLCCYSYFKRYGEREQVPVVKLHEAGFERLDFQRSWVGKITGLDEQNLPDRGWAYSDLVVSTSELMQVFPDEAQPDNRPVSVLRSSEGQAGAIASLPKPSTLTLEAPALGLRLAEDAQPVEKSQDDQPAAEVSAPLELEHCEPGGGTPCKADPLPLYLQFIVEMVPLLGGHDRIAALKKEEVEAEICTRWWPELGQPPQNLVGMMATMLRPPEARFGGAKKLRTIGSAASYEGRVLPRE